MPAFKVLATLLAMPVLRIIILSSTVIVSVLTTTVFPFTVKFPLIVRSLESNTSSLVVI